MTRLERQPAGSRGWAVPLAPCRVGPHTWRADVNLFFPYTSALRLRDRPAQGPWGFRLLTLNPVFSLTVETSRTPGRKWQLSLASLPQCQVFLKHLAQLVDSCLSALL